VLNRSKIIITAVLIIGLMVSANSATKPALFSATKIAVVDHPDTSIPNKFYASNRDPLLPSPLIRLPFGSIWPEDWLRKQLEMEADGFTGHLTEISPYCNVKENAWLNPNGIGPNWWEEVPYWFRGFMALGCVLHDPKIIAEAKPWVENMIASQTEFGYFGTQGNLFAPIHPAVPTNILTTPEGKPGLLGEYYEDRDFKTLKATRIDPLIDFDWGGKSPIEGIPGNDFTVRWIGNITVGKTGDYTFSLYTDDGGRLWVNGNKLIDNWSVQSPITISAKPIHLEAGKPYPLKIEYFQASGGSEIRLGWKMPGAVYTPRAGNPDLMPNMSMMFALRAYYEYTGDKRILDLLTKYFHWELSIPDNKFFSGGWQFPRNGDNLDSVYWLYNRTGDPKLLELGNKLMRTGARWMGHVNGGHNVDFSQGFRKPAQYYIQAKDPKYLEATETNYNDMYDVYGQVPGGMFGGDEFARPGHTDPQQAIETCGVVEMMLSQEILLGITGDLKWADRLEDVAFNTLPATMTADMKALRYLTSPNQCNSDKRSKSPILADGGPMQWMNPYEHRCCQHNSGMGWPYFAQSTWYATPGNGLAAIIYSPSKVVAKVGDGTQISITEKTHYPFDGRVEFVVATPKSVNFPLYLRIPGWCQKPRFILNGKPLTAAAKPKSFVAITRKWANGDKLVVDFPMEIRIRTWAKNKNSISVDRGPLTYSIKIAENYIRSGGTDKWPAWEIFPASPWNYGLIINKDNPAESFEVVKKGWPSDNAPFFWNKSPIELKVKAKRIPNWKENHWGLIDALQPSPVKSDQPVETISMIPMGAGRLRVSAIPVIGEGPDAHPWPEPEEPLASFMQSFNDYEAMFDGKLPKDSADRQTPHFTWWAWENFGTVQWVRAKFPKPKEVSAVEVYWYDEMADGSNGDVTLPEWWKLYYKTENEWKEVTNPSGYTIEDNKFNKVTFDPVYTSELKIEVKCRPGKVAGIHEWKID